MINLFVGLLKELSSVGSVDKEDCKGAQSAYNTAVIEGLAEGLTKSTAANNKLVMLTMCYCPSIYV